MERTMQQTQDFKWYIENLKDLYDIYGDAYLVIMDKTVLGKYKTFIEGVNEIKARNLEGRAIVQKCGHDKSAYTIYVNSPYIG